MWYGVASYSLLSEIDVRIRCSVGNHSSLGEIDLRKWCTVVYLATTDLFTKL